MAKNVVPRTAIADRWQLRPGEGHVIDASVKPLLTVGGCTASYMQIDFRKAPVPERHYIADTCYSDTERGTVRLMFGQRRIGKADLRSLLVLHMSVRATNQFLATIDQVTDPSYAEIMNIEGLVPDKVEAIPEEPPQTVALSANMALTAMAGDEACLDFYQASPFAVAAAPHHGKLAIDPVVRIDLRSTLMLGLLSELRRIVPPDPQLAAAAAKANSRE